LKELGSRNTPLAAEARISQMEPDEVSRLVADGAVLIDVRERDEYEARQFDGALHRSRGQTGMTTMSE
jgi:rhodanese-related sulfurtransferase